MSTNTVLHPVKPVAYQELGVLGRAMSTNRMLGLGLATALGLAGFLGHELVRMSRVVANQHPMVVRINEVGQAEAVNLRYASYTLNDAEIRYFVRQFARQYWGRDHRTLEREYPQSGYFLSPAKWQEVQSSDAQTKWTTKFLSSNDDDIEIEVRNVAVDESQKPKYGARVDFDKRYVSTTGTETKREHYAGLLYFTVDPGLALKKNALIPYNPLGFQIYQIREFPAFQ